MKKPKFKKGQKVYIDANVGFFTGGPDVVKAIEKRYNQKTGKFIRQVAVLKDSPDHEFDAVTGKCTSAGSKLYII